MSSYQKRSVQYVPEIGNMLSEIDRVRAAKGEVAMIVQAPLRPCRESDLSPSVHWAQHHDNAGGSVIRRRICDFELLYVASGALIVSLDGGEPTTARAGDAWLLAPGSLQRIEGAGFPFTRLIGIHFDFFDELDIEAEQHIVIDEAAAAEAFYCFCPVTLAGSPLFRSFYPELSEDIVAKMEEVVLAFARAPAPGTLLACRGALLQLLAALAAVGAAADDGSRPSAAHALDGHIRAIAAEMAEHPDRPWPNRETAERVHLSEDHFIRRFRRTTGMTPGQYVQSIRHREAKRLLRETDWKIERIAVRLGYADLHSFSHTFRKRQGVAPKQFRRLCRLI